MKGPAIFGSKRVISLCRMSVLLAFLALFSLPEPLGDPGDHEGARLRWKSKIATPSQRPIRFFYRKSCLDVGSNRDVTKICLNFLSHLPATQFRAESRRPGPKGILIGAPIPYTERPSAGFHGEDHGTPSLTTALLPRTGYLHTSSHHRTETPAFAN